MEKLLIYPENKEQIKALKAIMKALKIKFEPYEEPYNPEFIDKMDRGEKEFKKGEYTSVTLDDIWK